MGGGSNLDSLLKKALDTQERVEKEYRDENIKAWVVMFVNVSQTAKPLYSLGEEALAAVFTNFRNITCSVLKPHGVSHISPGEGPQVVCCFPDINSAINAAIDAQRTLGVWNKTRPDQPALTPTIGMYHGDVVFSDGVLEQSNTCNLAKRIETEASPGQIYVARELADYVLEQGTYPINYVTTTHVKNIPEPQEIFELMWQEAGSIQVQRKAPPAEEAAPEPDTATRPRRTPAYQRKPAANINIKPLEEEVGVFAILVVDVCESSRKFWKLGDRKANELISDYRNVIEPISKKYRCYHCESAEGDMMVVFFKDEFIPKSLDAACEIQAALLKRNLALPENRRVRAAAGVHLGEVKHIGREFSQGTTINTSKALQGEAEEDEILVSGAMYDALPNQLNYDLRFKHEAEYKGSPEPVPVFDLIWQRESSRHQGLEERRMQQQLQNAIRSKRD